MIPPHNDKESEARLDALIAANPDRLEDHPEAVRALAKAALLIINRAAAGWGGGATPVMSDSVLGPKPQPLQKERREER